MFILTDFSFSKRNVLCPLIHPKIEISGRPRRQTYRKGTAELSKIAPDVLGTSDGVFLWARRTFVSKIFQGGSKVYKIFQGGTMVRLDTAFNMYVCDEN